MKHNIGRRQKGIGGKRKETPKTVLTSKIIDDMLYQYSLKHEVRCLMEEVYKAVLFVLFQHDLKSGKITIVPSDKK